MGLFFKNKPKPVFEEESHLPALPEFPSIEEHHDEMLNSNAEPQTLPSYEPTISQIKQEVEKPGESDVPQRERKVMPKMAMRSAEITQEKPLFIKIDHYKDALRAVDHLKEKVAEAEQLLKIIEDIRTQEEQRLEAWKHDVQSLKDKLLSIDQNLFEL